MAKAKRLGDRPAPVILELSNKEADALYHLCWSIGGEPKGPRGVFSSHPDCIMDALGGTGAQKLGPYDPKAGNFTFSDKYIKEWGEK